MDNDPMSLVDLGADSPVPEPDSPGVSAGMFGAHDAPDPLALDPLALDPATHDDAGGSAPASVQQVGERLEELGVVGAGVATGGATAESNEEGTAGLERGEENEKEQEEEQEQEQEQEEDEEMNEGANAASRKRREEHQPESGEEEEQEESAPRPKKKSKRSRNETESPARGATEPPLGEEEERALRRRQELDAQISAAAKMGKKRASKKKGGADEVDLDMQADEEVNKIREGMLNAAAADHEAREAGKPATAKLNMLPIVMDTLQKSHLQQSILDNNLLEGVRRWLEPLPDKSLPNGIIQKALIPKLVDMDIDSITLKMSGLGKIMLFYSRCARVDLALRRTADKLIENWSRPVLKRSSSYRDRAQQSREYSGTSLHPARAAQQQRSALELNESTSQNAAAKARKRNAAPPPPVLGRDFQFAPVAKASAVMDERLLARQANHVKLNKFKRALHEKKTR